MSGGSWDYEYVRLSELADSLLHQKCPNRRAMSERVRLLAQAMHDIEWVDSHDLRKGDDLKAIKAFLRKNCYKPNLWERKNNMEIKVSSGGLVPILKAAQQQWMDDDDINSAVFAGQIMYILETEDNSDEYILDYLGFETKQCYPSVQAAKLAAPDFARTVLKYMRSLII